MIVAQYTNFQAIYTTKTFIVTIEDPCAGFTVISNNLPENLSYTIEHQEAIDPLDDAFIIEPIECTSYVTLKVNFLTPFPASDQNLISFDSNTNSIKTFTTKTDSVGGY